MKKFMLVFMACFVLFASVAPAIVDAKPRGGSYRSNTGSFKQQQNTPSKSQDSVNKDSATNRSTNSTGTANANRGFFSGGSFMKGLMIGGLAGMLFGGLFGGMGFMGEILGLLVNLAALFIVIFVVFAIVRAIFNAMDRRKKQQMHNDPYKR